jgi:hypothetical protein
MADIPFIEEPQSITGFRIGAAEPDGFDKIFFKGVDGVERDPSPQANNRITRCQ